LRQWLRFGKRSTNSDWLPLVRSLVGHWAPRLVLAVPSRKTGGGYCGLGEPLVLEVPMFEVGFLGTLPCRFQVGFGTHGRCLPCLGASRCALARIRLTNAVHRIGRIRLPIGLLEGLLGSVRLWTQAGSGSRCPGGPTHGSGRTAICRCFHTAGPSRLALVAGTALVCEWILGRGIGCTWLVWLVAVGAGCGSAT
jgi:hypothetical protein